MTSSWRPLIGVWRSMAKNQKEAILSHHKDEVTPSEGMR